MVSNNSSGLQPKDETNNSAADVSKESSLQEINERSESFTGHSHEHEEPLDVYDALMFLGAIKARFPDNVSVYQSFLDLMKDYRAGIINIPVVVDRASSLFEGHNDLFNGFKRLLPSKDGIVDAKAETKPMAADRNSADNGCFVEGTHDHSVAVGPGRHGFKLAAKPTYPLYHL